MASINNNKNSVMKKMNKDLQKEIKDYYVSSYEKEKDFEEWKERNYEMEWNDEEESFTPVSGFYCTGAGDSVYCIQGESEDFTACGQDCGYCGRCDY